MSCIDVEPCPWLLNKSFQRLLKIINNTMGCPSFGGPYKVHEQSQHSGDDHDDISLCAGFGRKHWVGFDVLLNELGVPVTDCICRHSQLRECVDANPLDVKDERCQRVHWKIKCEENITRHVRNIMNCLSRIGNAFFHPCWHVVLTLYDFDTRILATK